MAYVICEKCGGFYELQEGESFNDFDSCQCGGFLKYSEILPNTEDNPNLENIIICPSCKCETPNVNFCENCGALLNIKNPHGETMMTHGAEVYGVINLLNGDKISIFENKIILYPKNSKKSKNYYWNDNSDMKLLISAVNGTDLAVLGFHNNFEILQFSMKSKVGEELEKIFLNTKLNSLDITIGTLLGTFEGLYYFDKVIYDSGVHLFTSHIHLQNPKIDWNWSDISEIVLIKGKLATILNFYSKTTKEHLSLIFNSTYYEELKRLFTKTELKEHQIKFRNPLYSFISKAYFLNKQKLVEITHIS